MANEYEGGRQEGGAGDANASFSMPGPEKSGQAPVPPASAAPHVQGRQPESTVYAVAPSNVKTMNKHVFVWVMCFLLGNLGVDRFVRGQIGLGGRETPVRVGNLWNLVARRLGYRHGEGLRQCLQQPRGLGLSERQVLPLATCGHR